MYSDIVFARTPKGELEKGNLPGNLKRTFLLINGQSACGALVKHAPPSLREEWDENIGELLKGGYIAKVVQAVSGRHSAARMQASVEHAQHPDTASGAVLEKAAKLRGFFAAAREKAEAEAKQAALEMAQARADLEASSARRSAHTGMSAKQREGEDEQARAALEAAINAAKARSEAEAKAQAVARQQQEISARVRAEHEAAMAASQARAVAEAKQQAEKAARAQADREAAAASVQARAAELAKAQAEAILREQEAARTRAELEAAIKETRRRSESGVLPDGNRSQYAAVGMPAREAARLRELEFENDTLKKLLSEAYQEIALLKNRIER